ncbi:MAG: UDP-N-acetylmuramate--L-alanine ligase [Patescibacteria group bacterium]|nr:UDP-N-acetylmuramate--L-alanine ligase [Patescibacteria group bacterium]
MDLSKLKKVYMIGIKGVGMTMLAQFLVSKGYEVSGSDVAEVFMTDQILAKYGIKINQGFDAANTPVDADLIIYSSAYNAQTNSEVAKALAGKIKTLTYAEVLGEIFNKMYGIAVCGSHGKTTTTAWLGYVLWKAGLKPNVLVGARVEQFEGAGVFGSSDYMVIEADEYQNKLKYYSPKAVLLNNIDHDHHDFYPTLESYVNAFVKFIEKIPKKGFLITNFDDEEIAKIANVNCRGKIISYALNREDVDYFAYEIKQQGLKQFFKVKMDGEGIGDFSIQLSGRHNIYNALAVIAASVELGADLKDIRTYLEEFSGTDRRFKIMGKFNGATVIDDYGHHPTEIRATLAGARAAYPKNKITAVFHPHTFTRTKALLNEFAQSFSDADKVIVLDIYGSARETQGGVSSLDLIEKMREYESNKSNSALPTASAEALAKVDKLFIHVKDLAECEKYLRENIQRDEIIILIGAGDVFRVGEALIKSQI